MPYLNVRVSMKESSAVAEKIVSSLMTHTNGILGKKPEVTSIAIDFVAPDVWFIGGKRLSEQNAVSFYLDIKVTEGTNTKSEKTDYIRSIFREFQEILGPVNPASYIVIHDIPADSWGFKGKTQEYRFIQNQSF